MKAVFFGTQARQTMKRFFLSIPALVVTAALFLGCVTVGPDYIPPQVLAPERWNSDLPGGWCSELADPQTLASWWTTLEDQYLNDLIEEAIKGNLDLKEARARVIAARARRGIAEAGRFPTIDSGGSITASRASEDFGGGTRRELYAAGFDAGWELDLFGGIRRSIEAARAELEASQEDLRNVLVSLLAEVALNYIEVRTFQAQLAVAEANIEVQAETFALATFRFEAGLTAKLAVEQAKYNLESTRSKIPLLRSGLQEAKNRLAVLLGRVPGALDPELFEQKPVPVIPLEIAVGVPAETLRRRPDVRKAERELAAQTARLGTAVAELYPKFSLFGSIGLEALSLEDLFSIGNRAYSIGPKFSWNIFDAGAIRQNIAVQDALQEQALMRYEATILAALEEVENALMNFVEEQLRRESLLEATQAAQRAVDLSLNQYSSGLIDFRDVLESQRSLFSFQEQLAASEGSVTSILVSLYKALGGGWTPLAVTAMASEDVRE